MAHPHIVEPVLRQSARIVTGASERRSLFFEKEAAQQIGAFEALFGWRSDFLLCRL
jgi:hypothetical protein